MPIACQCPTCHSRTQAPDHLAGKAAKCRCGGVIRVPAPGGAAPAAAANGSQKIPVQCRSCGKSHRVGQHLAGKSARCSCGSPVAIPAAGPSARAASAPASQVEASCGGCGKVHRVGQKLAGKRAKCSCGSVVAFPAMTTAASAPIMADLVPATAPATSNSSAVADLLDEWDSHEMSLAPKDADAATQKKPKRTEDEVLASYIRHDDVSSSSGGGFGNGAMLRGMGMMIGAVVWFGAGLAFGILFFYPPILLVLGMLEFGRGIAFRD